MTTYTPHPTDDSLVIGDNGQVYAATRLPDTGWQFAEAWDILDTVAPGVIPVNIRVWLAGLIAGSLERVAREAHRPADDADADMAALRKLPKLRGREQ